MSASIRTFSFPRQMIVGGGAISQLPAVCESLGIKRPLIVTDNFFSKSKAMKSIEKSLVDSHLVPSIFDKSIPDPTTDSIAETVQSLVDNNSDGCIAIGGGSPMDNAKAACMLKVHGGKLRDYKAPMKFDKKSLPLIAVPTTSGTGSECTQFTVVTDTETDEKMLCIGLTYMPDVSVIDYKLTLTKPWRLTADTAIDSLTHAMEAFVSNQNNYISDALALSAMTTIVENVETACVEPHNHSAREKLMIAATQAGMAFSNSSVCLVHGMSRPLGAFFHIPHGLSNAMILPKVTEFSIPGAYERYGEIARQVGASSSQCPHVSSAELPAFLTELNRKLKVPSLQDYGIDRDAFYSKIPIMTSQALGSGSPAKNPRVPDVAELEELYKTVYEI